MRSKSLKLAASGRNRVSMRTGRSRIGGGAATSDGPQQSARVDGQSDRLTEQDCRHLGGVRGPRKTVKSQTSGVSGPRRRRKAQGQVVSRGGGEVGPADRAPVQR